MSRRFVVTAIQGHTDVTSFNDLGPVFLDVMVAAENHRGETVQFVRPLDDQPHVGDVVEAPEFAIRPPVPHEIGDTE